MTQSGQVLSEINLNFDVTRLRWLPVGAKDAVDWHTMPTLSYKYTRGTLQRQPEPGMSTGDQQSGTQWWKTSETIYMWTIFHLLYDYLVLNDNEFSCGWKLQNEENTKYFPNININSLNWRMDVFKLCIYSITM